MPDSAKKKKLVRQVGPHLRPGSPDRLAELLPSVSSQLVKQTGAGAPAEERRLAPSKKHARSRSFGGLIKVRPSAHLGGEA